MGSPRRLAGLFLLAFVAAPIGWPQGAGRPDAPAADGPFYYRPKLRGSETLEPFLRHLAPGRDSFPEEKEAEELAARLLELGERSCGRALGTGMRWASFWRPGSRARVSPRSRNERSSRARLSRSFGRRRWTLR